MSVRRPPLDRLIEKIRTDPDTGCWEWQGSRDPRGYGRIRMKMRPALAHRAAWELLVGPIPEGTVLDHLCRNHGCVRPDHLEPVTQRENLLRGIGIPAINAAKKNCSRGHPYSDDNTIPTRGGSSRECRECRRMRDRARYWGDPVRREATKERSRRQRERNMK